MTIEPFPRNRIVRIPVNGPFERVPSCAHDPGSGDTFDCDKCPMIRRVVDDVCVPDSHGCVFDRNMMSAAVEHLVAHGYALQKSER